MNRRHFLRTGALAFHRVLGEIWHAGPQRVGSERSLRRDPFCPPPVPSAPSVSGVTG